MQCHQQNLHQWCRVQGSVSFSRLIHQALFIDRIYWYTHDVVYHNYKKEWCQCVTLENASQDIKRICFTIWCQDSCLCVSIQYFDSIDDFSWYAIEFKNFKQVSRLTESKALLKSTKMRAAVLLQKVISSIILRNVRICPRVDRPGRKPFWFLRRIGSTLERIRFKRSLW